MESARLEAARCGRNRYNGNPCRVCGATERYTVSASCTACQKRHNDQSKLKIRELLKRAKGVE